jgi:hypothetical protein
MCDGMKIAFPPLTSVLMTSISYFSAGEVQKCPYVATTLLDVSTVVLFYIKPAPC